VKASEFITEEKVRLDPKCWKGKKIGNPKTKMKGGVRVNNCVKNESVEEAISKKDLLKQVGDKLNDPEFRKQPADSSKRWERGDLYQGPGPDDYGYTGYQGHGMPTDKAERARIRADKKKGVAEELDEEFDLIESIIDTIAERNQVDAEAIWEDLESLSNDELYVFATTTPVMEDWQKANKKDKTDGMSQKAVNAYRREHPGSKLKTAVTTKPGKLKKGSKASKRRKSYCSRSRGQMKMHNISCAKTPDKAICKARRRWNCE
jgi:hypothetical protein